MAGVSRRLGMPFGVIANRLPERSYPIGGPLTVATRGEVALFIRSRLSHIRIRDHLTNGPRRLGNDLTGLGNRPAYGKAHEKMG